MDDAGRWRLIGLLMGGAVVLVALGVVVALALSGNRSTVAETPSGEAPGKPDAEKPCDETPGEGPPASFIPNEDGIEFGSFDEMVATADLVAIGTVAETTPRVIKPEPGDHPGEMGLPTLDVAVRMDEVLKGRASDDEALATVKTLEFAYSGGDTEWRCPGERVLLFLSPSTEERGFYTTVRTNYGQSVYVLRTGKPEATVRDSLPDEVVQEVESLSLPELRREVGEEKIEKGEVKPLKREF